MRVRRPWLVVGHHHDAREEQFCLTVQRNAVTRVVGVSLSTYASAAAGALTEIELDVTREDVRALERSARSWTRCAASRRARTG